MSASLMPSSPSHPEFSVIYDGPALRDGRMAVRDLAPALIALGDALHDGQQTIYPLQSHVNLEIRAFDKGSFEVFLNLAEQTAVGFLTSPDATALVNLITFFMSGKDGLFALIKRLHGEEAERIQGTVTGTTILRLPDGTIIETPAPVVMLWERPSIRESVRRVVSPLEKEGIDRLEVRSLDSEPVVVEKGDLPSFDPPVSADRPLVDEEATLAVTVLAPDFVRGNKWRVTDGVSTFYVAIEDQAFWDSITSRAEVFRAGDTLIARVHIQQWASESGLRTERTIVHVEKHTPGEFRENQRTIQLGLPQNGMDA